MNRVILMGRLTRDPEVRFSQGDNSMAIARFTLAVDRRFKRDGDQTADFISCVAFGKTAEFIERYIKQGSRICVEGRIQTGSYTNRDNQKVYTTDVIVENAEFADSRGAGSAQQNAFSTPSPAPQPSAPQQPQTFGSMAAPASPHPAQQYAQPAQQPQAAPQFTAPVHQTQPEGFMNIADGLEDEGLPFNNNNS